MTTDKTTGSVHPRGDPQGSGLALQPASKSGNPSITGWSVVGNDRLLGTVYNRAGSEEGRIILTSPVVHIDLVGEGQVPLARTASGSAYWLGEPAASLGEHKGRLFVFRKTGGASSIETSSDTPDMPTTIVRLAD